jgi:hypothetical protein
LLPIGLSTASDHFTLLAEVEKVIGWVQANDTVHLPRAAGETLDLEKP